MSADINNIAIYHGKGVDYQCIIYGVTKSDAIHLLEHSMLDDCGFI